MVRINTSETYRVNYMVFLGLKPIRLLSKRQEARKRTLAEAAADSVYGVSKKFLFFNLLRQHI